MKPFYVYLLRCADGSYYCGQTDDIDVRMQQHYAGDIGYTSTRKPVELVWQGEFESREGALAFEQQIKGWSRAKKEALLAGDWPRIQQLAKSTAPVRPELVEAGGCPSTGSGRTVRSSGRTETGFAILSVNAGSSSIKFAVYPVQGQGIGDAVLTGAFEGLEPKGAPRLCWTLQGQARHEALATTAHDPFDTALQRLQQLLGDTPGLPPLRAVAHRVVHGGEVFTAPVRVTPEVLAQLAPYNSLAPLHQSHNLAGIRAFAKAFPALAQIACFDTAFHASVPALHSSFALPASLRHQGVRRYGFHGLSYQFIMGELQRLSPRAQGRVLMAHLGNGASLCAARGGRSVATTMGFSALDGLMMGTRSGNLDPGVLLYLMEQGWDHAQIETLLYKQSGLLGVSGISADMRTLRQSPSADARFAIDLFAHRVVRETGAMVACLQGLDAIAFSGGIGEHDAALRQQVCAQLAWLGVQLDEQLNRATQGDTSAPIHSANSAVEVWVIPTDEGKVSAQQALGLLEG